jgi:hypothetical protein
MEYLSIHNFTAYDPYDENQRHMPMIVIIEKRTTTDLAKCVQGIDGYLNGKL